MAEIQEMPDGINENKEISDIEKEKLGQLNLGLAGKPEDEQSHADDLEAAKAGEMTDMEKQKARAAFKKRLEEEENEDPANKKLPDTPDWAA
ncbi:hypothetical protein KGQ24_01960 [Patescibacteria group bacterium]|nr:hypothetical protein [Patescibacteria group bacterium]